MRKVFAVCVLLILPGPGWATSAPVQLEIRNRVSFAPAYIRARITVERLPENRELCLQGMIGDMRILNRCYGLNGADDARTHWISFKDVGPGRYVFTAVVRQSLSEIRSIGVDVRVLARGEGIDDSEQ